MESRSQVQGRGQRARQCPVEDQRTLILVEDQRNLILVEDQRNLILVEDQRNLTMSLQWRTRGTSLCHFSGGPEEPHYVTSVEDQRNLTMSLQWRTRGTSRCSDMLGVCGETLSYTAERRRRRPGAALLGPGKSSHVPGGCHTSRLAVRLEQGIPTVQNGPFSCIS
ncbi:unnamed protein product [Arctogadus glacialis]